MKRLFEDEEKTKVYLSQRLTGQADVTKTDLNHVAKLVREFGIANKNEIIFDEIPQKPVRFSLSITPKQDAEYMKAAESGDNETAERMVKEAAKAAMPDTKVVDENGEPRVVYRGEDSGRTVLDGDVFFIDSEYAAASYSNGEKPEYAVYLNIKNPLRLTHDNPEKVGTTRLSDSDQRVVGIYKEAINAMPDDWRVEVWGRPIDKKTVLDNVIKEYNGIEYIVDDAKSLAWEALIEYAKKNGYDGIFATDQSTDLLQKYVPSYITFSPEQIKSADPVTYNDSGNVIPLSERFNEKKNDIRFSVSKSVSPFYSNAAKAVEDIRQDKATPEQWLKMIEKAGGLKKGEDKWMGLSDWLKSQDKKTLTKQEVLDYIAENDIRIEEVEYGEDAEANEALQQEVDALWEEASGNNYDKADWVTEQLKENYGDDLEIAGSVWYDGKFHIDNQEAYDSLFGSGVRSIHGTRLEYTTKGLKNNREIALTVPTIEPYNERDSIHFGDAGGGRAVAWVRFGDAKEVAEPSETLRPYYELVEKYGEGNLYRNPEMTPEEIAIRDKGAEEILHSADNRKKVLVIDEIQSKRHQDGREKGYVDKEYQKLVQEENRLSDEYHKWYWAKGDEYGFDMWDDAEQAEAEGFDMSKVADEDLQKSRDMHSKWLEANKRRQSYERENPSVRQRNAVPDAPFDKNWHELAMKRMLRYAAENGYDKVAWTTGEQQAERYELSTKVDGIYADPFGEYSKTKEVRIFLADGNTLYIKGVDKQGNVTYGKYKGQNLNDIVGKETAQKLLGDDPITLRGVDLSIGGEGMKGFYDQILPKFMQKYGKKWGVKVGEVELDLPNDADRKMWSVDVNDAMRESVMQGQPKFSIGGKSTTVIDVSDVPLSNHADVREYAEEHFKEYDPIKGKKVWKVYTNKDTGNKISLSSDGINKSLSNKAKDKSVSKEAHLKAIGKLPQILEESVLSETHPDKNGSNDIKEIQRYLGIVSLGNELYRVKTTVKKVTIKHEDKNKYYSLEIQEMELAEERPAQQAISSQMTYNTNSGNSISLGKGRDNNSNEQENADKSSLPQQNNGETGASRMERGDAERAEDSESAEDVAITRLHEEVGHRGLSEVVGEQIYDTFLHKVYEGASRDMKERMNEYIVRNGYDHLEGVEEYIAHLAESGRQYRNREEQGVVERLTK